MNCSRGMNFRQLRILDGQIASIPDCLCLGHRWKLSRWLGLLNKNFVSHSSFTFLFRLFFNMPCKMDLLMEGIRWKNGSDLHNSTFVNVVSASCRDYWILFSPAGPLKTSQSTCPLSTTCVPLLPILICQPLNSKLRFGVGVHKPIKWINIPDICSFGHNIKIVHFIGPRKPWNAQLDESGQPESGFSKKISTF